MALLWKILPVFLTSLVGFGKISVPSAVGLFGFDPVMVLSVTCSGGLLGVIIFTNVSAVFLKWIEKVKTKYFTSRKKAKLNTKSNRRIINIKKRFGIWGIAFFTPIGLSIPVGTFIAERFYKDKKKVILVIGAGVVFWNVTIYFLLMFFRESLGRFL